MRSCFISNTPRTGVTLFVTVLVLVVGAHPSHASPARPPKWIARIAASTSTLENTCQCDCCYSVGTSGRTDCVPPEDTSFDVQSCAKCDVDTCASMFPITCGQASSIVTSDCIVRKGWILEVVPSLFIVISVVLLLYGIYKRFDGYNNISATTVSEHARVLPASDLMANYNSLQGAYRPAPPRYRHSRSLSGELSRPTTVLPKIPDDEPMLHADSMPPSLQTKNNNSALDPIPEFAPLGHDSSESKT